MSREHPSLRSTLRQGWIDGEYKPPSYVLAYEPSVKAYYVVVDDSTPVIELADELGATYVVEKNKCYFEDGIYICHEVQPLHDFPITDRQYFAWESLIPLLDKDYNIV